jgi:lipopolysaccharide transport system permease protein
MAEQLPARRPLPLVVNSADPLLAHPFEFARTAVADLRRSLSLALEMTRRDVNVQHRQSLFGPLLVVLPPLTMVLLGMGFRSAKILNVDQLHIPFTLYVLFGMMLWTTFLDALNAPIQGLLQERQMLSRTNSPPEAIVLGKLGPVLFNFGLKAIPLAVGMVWYDMPVGWALALAPLGLLAMLAIATALGLVLAPLNMLYRDVQKLVMSFSTLWFFLTPIYFPVPAEGTLAAVMRANPITPLLDATRDLATVGLTGDPLDLVLRIGASFLVLVPAWVFFRISLPITLEQANI